MVRVESALAIFSAIRAASNCPQPSLNGTHIAMHRAIVQKLDHFIEFCFIFHAAFEILAREELVVFVAQVNAGDERG